MIPRQVAAVMVVVICELGQQVVEVPFTEDDELTQGLQFDGFDEPLASTVEVGPAFDSVHAGPRFWR